MGRRAALALVWVSGGTLAAGIPRRARPPTACARPREPCPTANPPPTQTKAAATHPLVQPPEDRRCPAADRRVSSRSPPSSPPFWPPSSCPRRRAPSAPSSRSSTAPTGSRSPASRWRRPPARRTFMAGGNAVDAACAMLAATCTMWDTLSWGGETQALIYNPHTGEVKGDRRPRRRPHRRHRGLLPLARHALPAGIRTARRRHPRHPGRADGDARRVRHHEPGAGSGAGDGDGRRLPDRGSSSPTPSSATATSSSSGPTPSG